MISEFDIRSAPGPLRQIFWGALIVLIDININGFDLFHDVLGMILITIGVTRLAHVDVHERYRKAMRFVKTVAYLNIATSIIEMFNNDATIGVILMLVSLASLAAMIVFCIAMRWFCIEGGLVRSAESWWITTVLFAVIYAAPLGLFYVAAMVSHVIGATWRFRFGAEALLALAALLVPLVHFFVSTSRMKREAAAGYAYTGRGFEVLPPPDQQ